ncbi:MAG: polysaccharide deacetylase family protein [Acidobacteriota bacterium]|nr:MAG: polysaccharide deacetylase family protein [Acidobacteriota bacterium]
MNSIKQTMLNMMMKTGAFDLMRVAHRKTALILTYHRFSEREEYGKTAAGVFAEQLDYLSTHYRIVPLTAMIERLSDSEPLPEGMAAITIDDGYTDSWEIAYPLLRRYNAPATIYVVADFMDGRAWLWTDKARYLADTAAPQRLELELEGGELRLDLSDTASRLASSERINDLLKLLPDEVKDETIERLSAMLGVEIPSIPPGEFSSINADQALEMDRNGVAVGSHTMTHPILTNISEQRLARELQGSKARLEEVLGRRVEQFCYPNGDNDQRVRRQVEAAGYRGAVTCLGGLNASGADPLALRRIHTEPDFAHFLQNICGLEQLKTELRNRVRTPVAAMPGAH